MGANKYYRAVLFCVVLPLIFTGVAAFGITAGISTNWLQITNGYVNTRGTTYLTDNLSDTVEIRAETALTNTVWSPLAIYHRSTDTPAVGFGTGIALYADSTTVEDRLVGSLAADWAVASDGDRRSRIEVFGQYGNNPVQLAVFSGPPYASPAGNPRGYASIDLQSYRTAATQVAGGYGSVLSGGIMNTENANLAVIAGGSSNTVSGNSAVIGGGYSNTASGLYSTISGGYSNTASGLYSFAGGRQANAAHIGAFVWSDSTPVAFSSIVADEIALRARGGLRVAYDATSYFQATVASNGAVTLDATGIEASVTITDAIFLPTLQPARMVEIGAAGALTSSSVIKQAGGVLTLNAPYTISINSGVATFGVGSNAFGQSLAGGGGPYEWTLYDHTARTFAITAPLTTTKIQSGDLVVVYSEANAYLYQALVVDVDYSLLSPSITIAEDVIGYDDEDGGFIYGSRLSNNYGVAEGISIASGYTAHAEGDWTLASGWGSHAEGRGTKATASSSHAEGSYTIASTDYAHAEGSSTVASGMAAHVEGNHTVASGLNSHAEGYYSIASGTTSHAQGSNAYAALSSESAHAAGRFAVNGDAQSSQLIARRYLSSVNNDNWYQLFLDGATVQAVIPASTVWTFEADIAGMSQYGAMVWGYTIVGIIRRNNAGSTTLLASNVTTLYESDVAYDARAYADDDNEALLIQVKRVGGTSYASRWVATIKMTQVQYP